MTTCPLAPAVALLSGILALTQPAAAALDPADPVNPRNTQAAGSEPPSPQETLASLILPPELEATLFAAEPDVRQPIDLKVDDRGRVWVCEAYSYGEWDERGEDRIIILSDTNGDGAADQRKVFQGGFHHLSSVAVGFGGVWVLDAPRFLFIPDRDGDDTPDGPPEVLIEGWTTEAQHNVVNGLTWGPDGWLYGRHGITVPSEVGPPDTPPDRRIFIEPGVWRFHPVTRKFEVVLRGMTNPWGLDWNEDGEMFLSGNVNGHLWHGIPGALYERMFGAGSVPHDYERLIMIGERPHYRGTGDWKADWLRPEVGRDPDNDLGGGHSHCGLLIYQGASWPKRFHGHAFMANVHGRRINEETLEPRGASYLSRHVGDPIRVGSPWFRGVSLADTPEGDVLLSDWCDFGECHDADGVHRTSGRIYRIAARGRVPAPPFMDPRGPGLAGRSDLDLVKFQAFESEWQARRSRRVLQERAAPGTPLAPPALARLRHYLETHERPAVRLRAFWTLHAVGAATATDRLAFSRSTVPAHRVWGVRLMAEPDAPDEEETARLLDMARTETSPRVRLELASVAARLPAPLAWQLGRTLAGVPPAAQSSAPPEPDATFERVLWHVLEPHVVANAREAVALAQDSPIPRLRRFIVRRLGAALDDEPVRAALGHVLAAAAAAPTEPWARDVLDGAVAGLAGRRDRPSPPRWNMIAEQLLASGHPSARDAAVALSIAFNDAATLEALRTTLRSPAAPATARSQALDGLRQAGVPDLPALVTAALKDPALRLPAVRGLAATDDPAPAAAALALWPELTPSEKSAAIDALATRVSTARLLLDALARGTVPSREISVSQARQLRALDDSVIEDALEAHWGTASADRGDTAALVEKYRVLLTRAAATPPDPGNGRTVFRAACGACHTLFGEGGALGPDLTGGGRKDLDYLLHNILDPSAAVPRDYRMTVVTLKDGQVLSGVVPAQDDGTVTVQTLAERRVLDRNTIREIQPQPYSWMPEGLLQALPEKDLRDLIAYLQSDGAP